MVISARTGPRFRGVEGLRGTAAAGVLLGHVYLYSAPDGRPHELGPLDAVAQTSGVVGVVLFFTLSGFLLYRPYAGALLAGTAAPSTRSYIRNRFLRIFPAYWVALLVTGLVLRATYLPALEADGRSLAAEPGVLLANLLLVHGYLPGTLLTGIGPAWSLAVELAFYACLPLLAGAAALVARRTEVSSRGRWLAALAPSVVLLVLGQLGWSLVRALPAGPDGSWAGSWHAVTARSFLAHAGLFAAGMVVAVLHEQLALGRLRLPSWWPGAAGLSALLVLGTAARELAGARLSENVATLVMSIGCALALALVVLPRDGRSWLTSALACRPLAWSGLISYGVFLWHEPLIWFLRRQGWTSSGLDGFLLALLLTATTTAACALLSWHLVERPAMSLKRPSRADTEAGLGAAEPRTTPAGAAPPG